MTAPFRPRRGFTLVELLVVITIIGMLVALLLPAIGAARARMFQSQCANNLRQVGQAMINAGTSKGTLPGYIQPVVREAGGTKRYAMNVGGLANSVCRSTPNFNPNRDRLASRVSWATILLPRLDRNDIWERITGDLTDLPIRPIDVLICPVDSEARSSPENAALTYVANTGGWDYGDTTVPSFFDDPNIPNGDILNNGVFQNLVDGKTSSKLEVNDGTATTIMLSENIQKDNGYSWFGTQAGIAEQYFGMVWVANLTPAARTPPADNYDQVGIGKESVPIVSHRPWYARPGSNHPVGTYNVVFLDGHTRGMRPDIDYAVYQSLLTSNGRKCVDPARHDPIPAAIQAFRTRPPLSEADYGD